MQVFEADAERAAFAAAVMRDAGLLDYWIVNHPRRFSLLMGFCDRGSALMTDIAAAFGAEPRRSEMPDKEARSGPEKRSPPPPSPPEAPRESFADTVAGIGAGAAEGLLRGTPAGGAIAGALEKIPWEKLFEAILEGAKAKKDKDFLIAFQKALRAIDSLKDMLINLIDDRPPPDHEKGIFDEIYQGVSKWLSGDGDAALAAARKKKALEELRPKIRQAEELAHGAGRSVDKGDFDDARKRMEALVPLLQGIRDWIRDNMK